MTPTHRCVPCRTFATTPGRCSFCDEWMTPIDEAAMSKPTPAPDWPEVEPISDANTTSNRKPVQRKPRTRKAS